MNKKNWSFVFIEDNKQVRREVIEYLQGEDFSFGTVTVHELDNFEEALLLLGQRKVDLLILDVMGSHDQDKTAGIEVLKKWRSTGFSPVVFYTALPESVTEHENALIKVVGKEAGGLAQLSRTISEIFDLNIPQIHRAIVEHFDFALREYMWGFVLQNWDKLQGLVHRPDFVRLLLPRLAAQFSKEGVERVIEALHPGLTGGLTESHKAHPTEFYIKPPISSDPQLGDIRKFGDNLVVVVWPSCDLVARNGSSKVEKALCARAIPLAQFEEYKEWAPSPSNAKRASLESLMKNNRNSKFGQSERYHFLPGAWDIPASVIDFQDLNHAIVSEIGSAECLATVASPFAESIGARFIRYLGRLGTPDLDIEACLQDLSSNG